MRSTLTRGMTLVLALLLAATGAVLAAQDYPTQPVRLIVPYPPGGTTDMIARLYADNLGRELGQPVVVDNRPGASTNIGSDAVAKAKPDGHTVLFASGGPTMNSVFGPKPPFDPAQSLEPISLIARVPFMLAANPKAPFGNAREMIAAAKATPDKFSVSSAQLNVYVELLMTQASVKLLHVPYKGGAQAVTDATAGQVDMVFALLPVLLPQVQSGNLKPLGLSSTQRLATVLPGVPTFTESGVDFTIDTWYGLQAPAGTPAPVVERLLQATHRIVSQPAFAEKLAVTGAQAVSSQPAEMRKLMTDQKAMWERLAAKVPALLETESK